MSFWDNNKDSFKSAGKSTFKGITSGTKAVGQAGYRTYKKNEAKRKGVEYHDPIKNESKSGETNVPYNPSPLPSKDKLSSYQPPPKRNVGTFGVPQRGEASHYSAPAPTSGQSTYPANQQQYQHPNEIQTSSGYQEPPPEYLVDSNSNMQGFSAGSEYQRTAHPAPASTTYTPANQTSFIALPQPTSIATDNAIQNIQQQYNSVLKQPSPAPGLPPLQHQPGNLVNPPLPPQVPQKSNVPPSLPSRTSVASVASSTSQQSVGQGSFVNAQEQPKPKPALPDPGSFAPPPRRRDQQPIKPKILTNNSTMGNEKMLSPLVQGQSSSLNIGLHPLKSISEREHQSDYSDALLKPPSLPSRTSSSHSNLPLKQKPPKPKKLQGDSSITTSHTPGYNSNYTHNVFSARSEEEYATPPKPPRPVEDEEYTNPPKPPRPVEDEEYTNPPKPPRPVEDDEYTNPPKPPRPQTQNSSAVTPRAIPDATELSNKKPPPPKPLKKPSTLDGSTSSPPLYSELDNLFSKPKQIISEPTNSQSAVLSELNSIFQKMNFNKTESEAPASSPEVKPKPKPKPVPKPKPEMITKKQELPETSIRIATTTKPPPPVRRLSTPHKSPSPPPVPPARNYSRAPAPPPPKQSGPPNLDLELSSGWYAKTNGPLQLPKVFHGINHKFSYTTSSGSYGKGTTTLTVRLKDLSIVTYKFEYSNNDISNVNVVIEKYVPSPIDTTPSKQELIANHQRFGEYIASWCEHHRGKTVGRGECWDLAKEALQKGCGKHAFVSSYTIHGYPILQIGNVGNGVYFINNSQQLDEVRRGDILQFNACTFYDASTGVTQSAGAPDHTSVVIGKLGDKLMVLEQNVGGKRYVVDGEINLKNLTKGEVYVYRAMPHEWAGEL